MDLLALSRDLIAADTVSHHGTAAAVSILRPLYEAAGLAVTVQEVRREHVAHQNLLGTFAGADRGGLLLVTHLDTVDPGPLELWTETGGKPWALERKGDRVYGLGSADTKLDALCKLFAAREFRGKKLARSLQLLGTFEEEVGCKGARHFCGTQDFKARFASCSEPSELVIIRAHKGYAVVRVFVELPRAAVLTGRFERVVFEGKSAHSSTPHLGVNAIEKALAALDNVTVASLEGGTVANKVPARCTVLRGHTTGDPVELPDAHDASETLRLARALATAWADEVRALVPAENPTFDPASTIANWGAAQVTGAQAQLTFDARLLPGNSPEALIAAFSRRAEALAAGAGATLRIEVDRANPAMELKEPSALLSAARGACRDVGLDDAPQAKPTNTEAGVFAQAGIESIVFGPGRSTGNAHTPNEHNLWSQMEKAITFYRALITRLCVA